MPYHKEESEKNGVFISEVVDRREEVDHTAEAEPNRPVASVTQTLNDQDEDDNVGRSGK